MQSNRPRPSEEAADLLRSEAEPLAEGLPDSAAGLVERLAEARVVLLGEATHGTSGFYRARAGLTRRLIEEHGFGIVAVEADWPDAARIDAYVRHREAPRDGPAFTRFPTWMWRNAEIDAFVRWLRNHNAQIPDPDTRVGLCGLDLYSLNASIEAVLQYLDEIDPEAARIARTRYGCLSPWETDPEVYGRMALTPGFRSCEKEVVAALRDLLDKRLAYAARDGERFLDATQNARLIAAAERYYRSVYYGSRESWNLRDGHMFDTLTNLLAARGPRAKAIVWAHNSHLGNAKATEMGARGEFNVGQLCRERFGGDAALLGFGIDHGTVAAASEWGGPVETKSVRPARPES